MITNELFISGGFLLVDFGVEKTPFDSRWAGRWRLSALTADAAGQLDVLGHDGDALGVDRAQVGVLEQADQVRLRSLLQGGNGAGLEAQVRLEVLSNLAHQSLEGQLAEQQLSALLVAADLAERHGSRSEAMGLKRASVERQDESATKNRARSPS